MPMEVFQSGFSEIGFIKRDHYSVSKSKLISLDNVMKPGYEICIDLVKIFAHS